MKKYNLKYAYWGWKEFWAAIFPQKNAINLLKENLHKITKSEDIILLNSGRAAIRVALKAFKEKQPNKTDVMVPAYTCSAVIEAVKEEGLNPVFIDIGQNLNMSLVDIKNHDFSNILAIIAVHSYGYPLEIDTICEIAAKNDIFVIDDAAQVQGISYKNVPLGNFGDVGIFSFAQSKTLISGLSGSGGALLINNPNITDICQNIAYKLPLSSNRLYSVIQFIYYDLFEKYTKTFSYYWGMVFGFEKYGEFPFAVMNSVNASVLNAQFQRLDQIVDGKKKAINQYVSIKKKFPEIEFIQDIKNHYIIKLMLKLPQGFPPEKAAKLLLNEGIQTRKSYDLYWAENNPSCINAAKIAASMIEIPLIIDMTENDIKHILQTFQKVILKHD